ncbi:sensor histidine kinase [Prauserella shujinwangii]|uniref:sensor histidine kinase n=1 Tax=Prauserella shujinwangii TaxID=1453103 RepID=UPI000D05E765|nr:sensor histidine kinase [Prauserella shujinwangii]
MPQPRLDRLAALAVRGSRVTAGLALGGASAFGEFAFAVLAALAVAVPATRPRVFAVARALAGFEQWRLARFLGTESASGYSGPRALRYLALRSVVGGLGAGVFLLILWGAVTGAIMLWQLLDGQPLGGGDPVGTDQDWYDPIVVFLFGILLVFLAVQGLIGVAALERLLARRWLGPSEQERLRRRVSELATSRAAVVEAVNDERRRIERDLHDGVQQRLVALGMVLGRALRAEEPGRAGELLRQAHEEAQRALRDLREVTWRVYPVALDSGGLHVALESLAERSSLPVRLRFDLPARPDTATETVAYFVASEAVTNAAKHAGASRVDITVSAGDGAVVVRITDDGCGGAVPEGGGLSGLARRVAAADGEFTVDSPVGGPTTVTAVLPCG